MSEVVLGAPARQDISITQIGGFCSKLQEPAATRAKPEALQNENKASKNDSTFSAYNTTKEKKTRKNTRP